MKPVKSTCITTTRQPILNPKTASLLFYLLVCCFSIRVVLGSEVDKLEKIPLGEKTSWDDYSDPFLIVRTAQKYNKSVDALAAMIRDKLKANQLPLKTKHSSEGIAIESFLIDQYRLPKELSEEQQEEAIRECNKEKCQMKLKTYPEVLQLSKAKNKKETYRELLFNRIKNYLSKQELLGYENRKSNRTYVTRMVDLIPTLKTSPKTLDYLKIALFKESPDLVQPKNSWLRQEMVVIAPDQMQPILRISEDMEFQESGKVIFFELPIYTNHYFDSSISCLEIMSSKNKPNEGVLVYTDVMEIDELKKSALIRTLFMGKMVKAITQYQESFLADLETKGTTK